VFVTEVVIMNGIDAASLIAELKLFSGFSEEDYFTLEKNLNPVIKKFLKTETIYRDGDEIKSIGIILQGKVIGSKFYSDGRSHLIHTFQARDHIGLDSIFSTKKDSPITYVAAEDTVMMLIPYSAIIYQGMLSADLQLKLQNNIIRILADANIKSLYKLEVLSKRALRSRIVTFLSIMSKKTGSTTFCIGMDREQFAQYLCVNRSALSYELSQMKQNGLIDFRKDKFTIKYNIGK